jgi:hypothetical protein
MMIIRNPPRKPCILWQNVEKCGKAGQVTDDIIKLRVSFARCVTKAADTLSAHVILIDFPQQ